MTGEATQIEEYVPTTIPTPIPVSGYEYTGSLPNGLIDGQQVHYTTKAIYENNLVTITFDGGAGFEWIWCYTPGFNNLVKMAAMGARIICYGATRGAWQQVSVPSIFFKQLTIKGTTMGSDNEFDNLISFITKHRIVPVIDSVYPLSEVNAALERMKNNQHFGKIILTP